jgi:hypothetical protein
MFRATTLSLIAILLTMILTSGITRATDETYQQVPLFDDGVMIHVPVNAFGNPVAAFGDLHIGYRFIHVAGMIRNIFPQLAVLIIDAITSMGVVIGVIADLVRIRGCIDS